MRVHPLPLDQQLVPMAKADGFSATSPHRGRMHVVRDGFLYAGDFDDVTTQRQSVVLYLAMTDREFEVQLPDARVSARAAIVGPGVRNRVVGNGALMACVDIDATHRHFSRLARAGFRAQVQPPEHFKETQRALKAFCDGSMPHTQAEELYAWLTELVVDRTPTVKPLDERVLEVIRMLRRDLDVTITELAMAAGLSESWLIHLFHREVGITLRQYERTLRLQLAAAYLKRGLSLTEVAAIAGFADLAHFSKMWKVNYGFAPQRAFAGKELCIDPIPWPSCIEVPPH